ncbi:MAG: hypothetical protein Q8P81_04485 [Nanoarchaeota archaeon]|nr:hypothetical protein [Nanoarchaeota archaeon]
MAEQEQTPSYSFEKYQYGALAGLLAGSEETKRYAPSALEILAGSKGLNLGEEAEGFVRGTYASEKGLETAIKIYAGSFMEKKGEYTPSDLAGWYSDVLAGLSDEEAGRITQYLGEYAESLSSINKRVSRANHILEGKNTDANTDEQVREAEKVMEKYGNLLNIISVLDRYKFEKLKPTVIDAARKKDLKNLASQLPPVKKAEAEEQRAAA